MLREIRADVEEIFGDSIIVINQLVKKYECKDDLLQVYHGECVRLLKEFKMACIEHIPKDWNDDANGLARHASGYGPMGELMALELPDDDWRKEIVEYLKYPSKKVNKRIRFQSAKYVLLEDDLYYQMIDGVLLKCIRVEEAKVWMGEIREGVSGAHQSAFKMKWIIKRNGYFWPTILEDCFRYYKGSQDCQRFGNFQRVLTLALSPIIRPWPFRS